MTYEVVDVDEKRIRGMEIFVNWEVHTSDGIAGLWMDFIQKTDLKSLKSSYGVSKNLDVETLEFDYMAGSEDGCIVDSEGTTEWVIPGGRYARFSNRGLMTRQSIAKFYEESFKSVFASGRIDSERGISSFELYDKDYIVMGNTESLYYLLIPVLD